jgi:hypothetical protein
VEWDTFQDKKEGDDAKEQLKINNIPDKISDHSITLWGYFGTMGKYQNTKGVLSKV